MTKSVAVAFVAGLVFALGLGLSGMTNPAKVIAFLDFGGRWDADLAFVMAGAIAVHLPVARWALRARRPLDAERFSFPTRVAVDLPLIGGSAMFGIGWGLSGYCPGPALVSLGNPSLDLVVFVAAMVTGIVFFGLWRRGRTSAVSVVDPRGRRTVERRSSPRVPSGS